MSNPTDSRGFYIRPHRLGSISDAAHKVVKLLLTYGIDLGRPEMEIVLDIARDIINAREAAKSDG